MWGLGWLKYTLVTYPRLRALVHHKFSSAHPKQDNAEEAIGSAHVRSMFSRILLATASL